MFRPLDATLSTTKHRSFKNKLVLECWSAIGAQWWATDHYRVKKRSITTLDKLWLNLKFILHDLVSCFSIFRKILKKNCAHSLKFFRMSPNIRTWLKKTIWVALLYIVILTFQRDCPIIVYQIRLYHYRI